MGITFEKKERMGPTFRQYDYEGKKTKLFSQFKPN